MKHGSLCTWKPRSMKTELTEVSRRRGVAAGRHTVYSEHSEPGPVFRTELVNSVYVCVPRRGPVSHACSRIHFWGCVDHLICTDRIRQSASYETNSKWSSSTTCWEFFHHFLSDITVKLIDLQIFLLKYDHLRTDAFLRLMPSGANGCYGINLSCSTLFYQNSQATNLKTGDSL